MKRSKLELDPTDLRLLEILQEDASLPIQELAERVGLSSNPCWRRIKRLEAEGVIKRRVALVDPVALGYPVTVYVRVNTGQHSAEWLRRFAEAVRSMPEIAECHRLSGDVDYLLKILAADIADYDRVYKKLIERVPNLTDVSSMFSMEMLKSTTKIPTP
jgi:Lrp/AsnC family transcriptional regulator